MAKVEGTSTELATYTLCSKCSFIAKIHTYLKVHTFALVWDDKERVNRTLGPPRLLTTEDKLKYFILLSLSCMHTPTHVLHLRGRE